MYGRTDWCNRSVKLVYRPQVVVYLPRSAKHTHGVRASVVHGLHWEAGRDSFHRTAQKLEGVK